MIIETPSTLYIKFTGSVPKIFIFGNPDGTIHFFRYITSSVPRIKFNVPIPGEYDGNVPFDVVKIVPIEIPFLALPVLPPADRARWCPDPQIVFNGSLDTIARNFTDQGIIEVGPRFQQLIPPMKVFIIQHEKGHFLYSDEFNADLFALVNFVRMGYNVSTAYYTLEKYLSKSPQQVQRLRKLFENINSVQPFKSGT